MDMGHGFVQMQGIDIYGEMLVAEKENKKRIYES